MFREGLRQLIDREPDLTVCGDAAEAETALQEIRKLKPDLVVVDITLGGTSGIDLIKAIKSENEDFPVLVVSMHDESLYGTRLAGRRHGLCHEAGTCQNRKNGHPQSARRRHASQRKNGQL